MSDVISERKINNLANRQEGKQFSIVSQKIKNQKWLDDFFHSLVTLNNSVLMCCYSVAFFVDFTTSQGHAHQQDEFK